MTQEKTTEPVHQPVGEPSDIGRAGRGEILAWASYDIANATYGVVVATAVYNAYFVTVIAGNVSGQANAGFGTWLLTLVICISSLAIVLTAPVIGTIADATAAKKKILLGSTILCIACTVGLSLFGPGQVFQAAAMLALANIFFGTGEDLIASFLPELSTQELMGRISALGWAAGYIGGLLSLGICLAYVSWAQSQQQQATQFVPVVVLISAAMFSLFVIPTFIWLKERAKPDAMARGNYVKIGFTRLMHTVEHASHYRDLFNFLLTLFVYSCGTTTVIHLASVYAQEVFHFTTKDSIVMILVVSATAAIGAGIFGFVQDRIGSIKTLYITLSIWTLAIAIAVLAQTAVHLWIAANFVGIAMGSTGSAGRALVGQFSPAGRCGEFLGLWGVAHKLATAVGALTFGAVTVISGNNYRLALLTTVGFFIGGMLLLMRVNEQRGRLAARTDADVPV